jgi:hypothetical protein
VAAADVADPRFTALCKAYENKKWIVPPEGPGEMKGGGMVTRPAPAKQQLGLMMIAAERVNSTLYWAERLGAVPVSNHELFNRVYGVKLRRALENRDFWDSRGLRDQMRNVTISVLSWELFSEIIPLPSVSRRSIEEIIRYKQESSGLQERYRSYVGMLEAEVTTNPWEASHAKEIDKLVRGKVIPEMQKLSDERRVIWEKLFGEVVRVASQKKYLVPLIAASLIPGVSYIDLLQYGVPVMAAQAMPKVVELALERRQLRRNALFFLLNFR